MGKFRQLWRRVKEAEVVRSLAKLVGGNVLSQLLVFAAIPLLSRVYSPEDFGVAGKFMAVAGILMVVSCLRYEAAILLGDDIDASRSFRLSIFSGGILGGGIVVALICMQLYASHSGWGIPKHWWLLPVFVIANALVLAVRYRYTRDAHYGVQIRSNILRSFILVISQLLLSVFFSSGEGLIVGQMLAVVVCAVYLCFKVIKCYPEARLSDCSGVWTQAQKYSHFFYFGVPQSLFSAAGYYFPVVLLGVYYDDHLVGVYFMLIKLMTKPLQLISDAVRRVLMNKFSRCVRRGGALLKVEFVRWSLVLTFVAALGFGLFSVVGGKLVVWGLGHEWEAVRSMIPWFCLLMVGSLIAIPASVCLQLREKQKQLMIVDGLSLVARVVGLAVLSSYVVGVDAVKYLCVVGFLGYLLVVIVAASNVLNVSEASSECM